LRSSSSVPDSRHHLSPHSFPTTTLFRSLCMSAQAFGSEWAQLKAGTFRFRDPQNMERRFIPLRIDEAPIKGSLTQFPYISMGWQDRKSTRLNSSYGSISYAVFCLKKKRQ